MRNLRLEGGDTVGSIHHKLPVICPCRYNEPLYLQMARQITTALQSLRRLVQSAICSPLLRKRVFYCPPDDLFFIKGNVIQRFLHRYFNGFLKDTAVKAAVVRLTGNNKIVAVRIAAGFRVNQAD